jgi:RNA polymerase sigma-70 factor (ECF subfamily)
MTFSTDLFLEYKKRPGKAALARLLERHQDAVYSVCHHVLRHPQDAEDACQEVLLEISRHVDRIEEPERFSGWLYRTALHTALDVKRKRGRQRARDAASGRAPAAAPESAEALHEGLAGLDDASRALVVEHYFGQRPLRELAAERGCSEVAVWKRIQSARERLKRSLGSAVVSALDDIGVIQAPGRLLGKALLRGGLTMAASTGIKVAIVGPLLLLAGAGVVMMARRPEPPAPLTSEKPPALRRPVDSAAPSMAGMPPTMRTTTAAAAPIPAKTSAPRRPYPLKVPAAAVRSQAAERTWSILHTMTMSIDEQNVSAPRILQRIAQHCGIVMAVDPEIGENESISFKVQDIVVDGCLRLMLQPRNKGYEIRSDGVVVVAPTERLSSETPEIKKVKEALEELGSVRDMLDRGWDGLRDPDDVSRLASEIRAKKITVPQGETSLREELQRLRDEYRVVVHPECHRTSSAGPGGVAGPGVAGGQASPLDERFLQVVEEKTLGDHLDQLARRFGLSVVDAGGDIFWMTPTKQAQNYRSGEEQRKRQYLDSLEVLTKPLPEAGALSVQDLLDSIPRSFGVELLPDQEAWDSAASVTLGTGATLRDALDAIKAQGFRWALLRGKLLVLK